MSDGGHKLAPDVDGKAGPHKILRLFAQHH